MATFLFDKTIFGPVISRRLGTSLGINLLPNDSKVCNFNCVYCECGWTPNGIGKQTLPTLKEVSFLLEEKLKEMESSSAMPDTITFAGNGEPTLHPDFLNITKKVIQLRNQYCSNASVAVLSNATTLSRPGVNEALKLVDKCLLKLDSGIEKTCIALNRPVGNFSLPELVNRLKSIHENLTIQTLFVRGTYENVTIDNTTEPEVNAWLSLIKDIHPVEVMLYTIARDTAASGLIKVQAEELKTIASMVEKLGIKTTVSA
jgi:wyosine [tRNA(Phe)-imidazoG37] synthetase (radical SAM superfamily)